MTIGHALAIFLDIENPSFTVEEKGTAIRKVIEMETHNGVTKEAILRALNWLLHEHYDIDK